MGYYVAVAPSGHHPLGEEHQNALGHVKHPYKAMMYLVGDEGGQKDFCGLKVEGAPSGLFLERSAVIRGEYSG